MKRSAIFFAALAVSSFAFAQDGLQRDFIEKSAKAVGIPQKGSWILKGKQKLHGNDQPFEMRFDTQFRYKMAATGSMPEALGFDGKAAWVVGPVGVPHHQSGADRDISRLEAYVISGLWVAPNSPVEISPTGLNECTIKCKDGTASMILTLDPITRLPKTLTSWSPTGGQQWTFSNYVNFGGVMLPSVADRVSGSIKDRITIIASLPGSEDNKHFEKPASAKDGYIFDAAASPDIEVQRKYGYLFVKPKINGADEGWWFLDTGADVMVIDPTLAKKHDMKVVGTDSVAGVVASVDTAFSTGISFQLGPLTLKNSSYMHLDLSQFGQALGLKIVGIVGYDFMSRASLDIDPKKSTIGVYAPGKAPLPKGVEWTPFVFHSNIPVLTSSFEGDRSGHFSLDTGSGSTVDFFSPVVEKYELLKNRKVQTTQTGGAGGSTESKMGNIEWFQLGAKRFENPSVGFQITKKGAFASPYLDGNIGMGFLGRLHFVLDYENQRLALFEEK